MRLVRLKDAMIAWNPMWSACPRGGEPGQVGVCKHPDNGQQLRAGTRAASRLVRLFKISASGRSPEQPNIDMTEETTQGNPAIAQTKQLRKDLDAVLSNLKRATGEYPCNAGEEVHVRKSRERSLAVTKIQEAIMWLGMDLKDIGETPNPYPHSYDPVSPVLES